MTFPRRGRAPLHHPKLAPQQRSGRATWASSPTATAGQLFPGRGPAGDVSRADGTGNRRNRAAVPEFPRRAMRPTEVHMTLFTRRLLIGVAVVGTLSSGPGAKAAPSLVGTLT